MGIARLFPRSSTCNSTVEGTESSSVQFSSVQLVAPIQVMACHVVPRLIVLFQHVSLVCIAYQISIDKPTL